MLQKIDFKSIIFHLSRASDVLDWLNKLEFKNPPVIPLEDNHENFVKEKIPCRANCQFKDCCDINKSYKTLNITNLDDKHHRFSYDNDSFV